MTFQTGPAPVGVIVSGDVCSTQPKWTRLLTDCEDGEDGGVGHKAGEGGSPDAEGEERARADGMGGGIGGRGRVLARVALVVLFRRGGEVGRDGGEEEEAGDDVDDDEVYHQPAMKPLKTLEIK